MVTHNELTERVRKLEARPIVDLAAYEETGAAIQKDIEERFDQIRSELEAKIVDDCTTLAAIREQMIALGARVEQLEARGDYDSLTALTTKTAMKTAQKE